MSISDEEIEDVMSMRSFIEENKGTMLCNKADMVIIGKLIDHYNSTKDMRWRKCNGILPKVNDFIGELQHCITKEKIYAHLYLANDDDCDFRFKDDDSELSFDYDLVRYLPLPEESE